MVLETAIPEHLTVLSATVQQVLHTEIHIQPILETIPDFVTQKTYIL